MYEKEGRYYSSMNETFCEYLIEFVATAEKGYFLRVLILWLRVVGGGG